MNTKTGIAVVIALIVVAGGFFFFNYQSPLPITASPTATSTEDGLKTYSNEEYDIAFSYPSDLYLFERTDAGTSEKPQLSLFLVEDTEENRAVLEGRSTVAREGPPGISIDVYQNPEGLSAEAWMQANTNWAVATRISEPVTMYGHYFHGFSWSGLYEGMTNVTTEGEKAYVFSVTWLSEDDRTLKDFESIASSLSL